MIIAVTRDESGLMPGFFGKSTSFLVAEAVDGRITARRVRRPAGPGVTPSRDAQACLDVLRGCDCLICKGIGPGMADALRGRGIVPYVVDKDYAPDEALAAFLEGRLRPSGVYRPAGG